MGIVESWEARNARFDIGWVCFSLAATLVEYADRLVKAALEANGAISKHDALALGTTNLQMWVHFIKFHPGTRINF